MKNFLITGGFILALLLNTAVTAQTYEEWVKQREQAFGNFVDDRRKALYEFLKNNYAGAEVLPPVKSTPGPKITTPPVYQGNKTGGTPSQNPSPDTKPTDESLPGKTAQPGMSPEPVPEYPPEPAQPAPSPSETGMQESENTLSFTFLYHRFSVPRHKIKNVIQGKITSDKIAEQFREITGVTGEAGLSRILKLISSEGAVKDDYTALRLLFRIADQYGLNNDGSRIFTWYILSSSGIDARLGFTDGSVLLFISTDYPVFNTPFVRENGKRYYLFGPEGESLSSITGDIWFYGNETENKRSLKLIPAIAVTAPENEFISLSRSVTVMNDTVRLDYRIGLREISLTKDYPSSHMGVYIGAGLEKGILGKLRSALSPHLANLSEYEKVNFLLRFTQLAGGYKTDNEQFGREKPMFLNEFLYYPDSDCEDRSLFFAFIVRNMLGLDCVIIEYDNHAAVGVELKGNITEGDFILHKGRKFLICDPTYINADAGKAMPDYKNAEGEIVEL